MTSEKKFPNCVRGYVFVVTSSQDQDSVARNILNLNKKYGTEVDFIIRADTMQDLSPENPSPYDIVVAVNAATNALFDQIKAELRDMPDVTDATTAIVKNYHNNPDDPYPPHVTPGYVSSTEFGNGNPLDRAGPQDHNVWG
jgi:hypothetical protein